MSNPVKLASKPTGLRGTGERFMEVALVRRSICECGYGVLRDDIPLGTIYTIDLDSVHAGFMYQCGRCGTRRFDVRVVSTSSVTDPRDHLRPLPFELFESPAFQSPATPTGVEIGYTGTSKKQ